MHIIIADCIVQSYAPREAGISISIVGAMKCPGTCLPSDLRPLFSNTSVPEQEFSAQTEKISRVGSYDRDTRSWYTWIPLDRAERAAEMLTTLFETARLHGTTIQVLAQPAGESSQSGQEP